MMKIQLLLFAYLIVGCLANLQVSIDQTGRYVILVNGKTWLRSSRTALYVDDRWYSSDDQSLLLMNITTDQGTDRYLGRWNETQLNYDLIRHETHTKIVASIRQWQTIPAITFHLDTGDQTLINTIPLHRDEVRTVFPSFQIERIDQNDQRAYFTFAGKNITFSIYSSAFH